MTQYSHSYVYTQKNEKHMSTQIHTQNAYNIYSKLFITAKKVETNQYPSTDEWINQIQYIVE